MPLTVGTDTYITAADALAYVTAYYASADAKAIAWLGLSTQDREARLRQAARTVDAQPLTGIKITPTQLMAFPRLDYTEYRGDIAVEALSATVPEAVKQAQVEIALTLAQGLPMRARLQREGVKSYSIGKASETFDRAESGFRKIPSPEARELLRPYLAGAVSIT